MPPPARPLCGRPPLLLLLVILTSFITVASSDQRLSAFLTPADIAALRAEQNGESADAATAAALGDNKPPRILNPPTLSCVLENTTSTFISLEVRVGESGAPFGVLIEWMNVVAFARNDGWYRATDPRLCRLRLTTPIAPDECVEAVIGGEAMLERLPPEPRPYPNWGLGKKWKEENDKKDANGGHDDHPPRPMLPGDAVFGNAACLEDLEPGTYYVFRARARGTVDALRRGGEEEDDHKEGDKKKKKAEGEGEGERKDDRRRGTALPAVEPSLWSANEVCETRHGGVLPSPSPPPPVMVDLGP